MKFKTSYCDPFQPDVIELGFIEKDQIIENFEKMPWAEYLRKWEADEDNAYWGPSLDFENIDNNQVLSISVGGNPNKFEFLIFYFRPKKVRRLFGLIERNEDKYMSEKQSLTKQDVIDCLQALIRNDTEYLENKIGR